MVGENTEEKTYRSTSSSCLCRLITSSIILRSSGVKWDKSGCISAPGTPGLKATWAEPWVTCADWDGVIDCDCCMVGVHWNKKKKVFESYIRISKEGINIFHTVNFKFALQYFVGPALGKHYKHTKKSIYKPEGRTDYPDELALLYISEVDKWAIAVRLISKKRPIGKIWACMYVHWRINNA